MSLFKGKNDLRCPVCLFEFNLAAMMAAGVRGCPNCKTSLQPLKISEDGYIKANWQDMRMLAIFAQRWSITFDLQNGGNRDSLRALQNILNNLRKFTPAGSHQLTPPFDAIIVQKQGNNIRMLDGDNFEAIELGVNAWKPDHTGMVPSPFFKKKPPL